MTACSAVVLLVERDIIVRNHWLSRRDNRADHHSRACSPVSSAGQGSYSFAPHLRGGLSSPARHRPSGATGYRPSRSKRWSPLRASARPDERETKLGARLPREVRTHRLHHPAGPNKPALIARTFAIRYACGRISDVSRLAMC